VGGKRTGDRRPITVVLAGHEYRIVSDGDEESLQKLAGYVDAAMANIRSRTGTVDSLEVALLTSLNMARELLALRARAATASESEADDIDASEGERIERLIELIEEANRVEIEAIGEEESGGIQLGAPAEPPQLDL